jgi:hypothetical protein
MSGHVSNFFPPRRRMAEDLSDYERLRQSNISRNEAILDSLELSKAVISLETPGHGCKNAKADGMHKPLDDRCLVERGNRW